MGQRRFPFSSYCKGWYKIAYSEDLTPGAVKPLSYFGRALALFRTETGAVKLFDAYCPHLGAHLGHGGQVEKESLRCPFHGWTFDEKGICIRVPYSQQTPPKAQIHTWPVLEQDGIIFMYYDPENSAPTWNPPSIEEYQQDGWVAYERRRWKIKSHVQELAENIPDGVHFHDIHHIPCYPQLSFQAQDHRFHVIAKLKDTLPNGRQVDVTVESKGYGLGLWLSRFSGVIETLVFLGNTPIDEDYVDMQVAYLVKEGNGAQKLSKLGMAMVEQISKQIEQDIPIWENKQYVERPILVQGDGPIDLYRQWVQQFY